VSTHAWEELHTQHLATMQSYAPCASALNQHLSSLWPVTIGRCANSCNGPPYHEELNQPVSPTPLLIEGNPRSRLSVWNPLFCSVLVGAHPNSLPRRSEPKPGSKNRVK
jgi:hypothetical protein